MRQIKYGVVTDTSEKGIKIACVFRLVDSERIPCEHVIEKWFPKKCVSVKLNGDLFVQSWLIKSKETEVAASLNDRGGDCMTCELLLVDEDEGEE